MRWIAIPLCLLFGSVIVPARASAQQAAKTVTCLPELGVAVVSDGGALEVHRFVERWVRRPSAVPRFEDRREAEVGSVEPATEVVPIVETHRTRLDAAKVASRRVDGRQVSSQALRAHLAKPTGVVLAKQGHKLDALFAPLFKPESLVLFVPPEPPPTVTPHKATYSPRTPSELVAVVAAGRGLELRRFLEWWGTRTINGRAEVASMVVTEATRWDAAMIVASRIDGRSVASDALLGELARPTPAVLANQQLDPRLSQLLKPESLVLRLAPGPPGRRDDPSRGARRLLFARKNRSHRIA